MAYQTDKRRDASLGLALMVSVGCGVAAFVGTLKLSGYLVLVTGVVKLHLFEYPARSNWRLIAAVWGCVGVALLVAILVMRWSGAFSGDSGDACGISLGYPVFRVTSALRMSRAE
jgi:hypothetical protein